MLSVLLFVRASWPTLAAGAALTAAAHALARRGPRTAWRSVRPVIWLVVTLALLQAWQTTWSAAGLVAGNILVVVAASGLLTETTPVSALLALFTRGLQPLRLVGIDPERPALVLALTIRTVTVLDEIGRQVKEARWARGHSRSIRAFAIPFVIRSISHAQRTGDALAARGFDD